MGESSGYPGRWPPANVAGMPLIPLFQDLTKTLIDPAKDPVFRGTEIWDIRLIGINQENGFKLLLTIGLILVIAGIAAFLHWVTVHVVKEDRHPRAAFWVRQVVLLGSAFVLLLGLMSIWFDDPGRLATPLGLVTAGLAFALQRVVTAIAGYFVILRGKLFRVGDRIVMGGVRGDVIALGLTQTTILEMGQPPAVSGNPPDVWVRSRQYTGRVVNVPNANVFEEPIYNYSMQVPFIWEEISLPVSYTADRRRAEEILHDAAKRHASKPEDLSVQDVRALRRQHLDEPALEPSAYYRLTDNWLELTVRFVCPERGVRDIKDRMSRDILSALDAAGIGIASATFEITGLPPLRLVGGPTNGSNEFK